MKKSIATIAGIAVFVCLVTSFTFVDFTKSLIGKWELKTLQQPGKAAVSTKEILGESFMEFKSNFTYVESGESSTKGVWKITSEKFLQTKEDGKENFTEQMELKELSADKIQITSSTSKIALVYERVK